MHKGFLKTASVLACLAVILGAFAAHGLRGKISDHALTIFETATQYLYYHVIALFVTAIVYKEFRYKSAVWAGWLFISGIILFCGSLYALSIIQAMVIPGYKWIGPVTPFGGGCFIAGWIMLFITFFKRSNTTAR